jgi:hypothetical protein
MIEILRWLAILISAAVSERRDLALENLAVPRQYRIWLKIIDFSPRGLRYLSAWLPFSLR